MPKKTLLCLDTDPQSSVFDSVVALDAGVDVLLRHAAVTPDAVKKLVQGLLWTRGGEDLRSSAVFIGGSDVTLGEHLLQATRESFLGATQVSVLLDSNGANTTAAAAVVCAGRHVPLGPETIALVLGATGSIGQRVVRMLAHEGVDVRVASRRKTHAEGVCHRVAAALPGALLSPHSTTDSDVADLLDGVGLLISTGAVGVQMLPATARTAAKKLQVVIDVNAVPPAGIGGVAATDKATQHGNQVCYGALGVTSLKMKIHKAAIRQLFEASNRVLDCDEIYAIGKLLANAK